MLSTTIQTALQIIYPPKCMTCSSVVDSDFGLCGACWRDTQFIGDITCDSCGAPLVGEGDVERSHCDDCLKVPRPWTQGRSALIYQDNGRRIVLGLKHGDRHDFVGPAALWMSAIAREILDPKMLVIPVPLHWTRLVKRRYNQSALLAEGVAKHLDLSWCPDALQRLIRTQSLDGMGQEDRFTYLKDTIKAHPKRRRRFSGRPVLLIDDVMTSGATLSAATHACLQGGSGPVSVLTLARALKDA